MSRNVSRAGLERVLCESAAGGIESLDFECTDVDVALVLSLGH